MANQSICPYEDMVLLSVITVCRNDSKRLKITINSLIPFYSDSRFEHIIVDGDSNDETELLVKPLLQKKNFKFVSNRDSGIYDAMNRGAEYSRAPLLLFLNCGDTIIASPTEIHAALSKLVAGKNVELPEIACFSVQLIGSAGYRTLLPVRLDLHKMPTSHQGMVFCRNFVLQKKYQTTYRIAGDYDLYLRANKVELVGNVFNGPLASVELDGVASANPIRAYFEYLLIARIRLVGWPKVITIIKIGIRAICVISIKSIISKGWAVTLRRL